MHVVYDGVGKDTWEENFEVIRRKGTIVTFGNASVSASSALNLSPDIWVGVTSLSSTADSQGPPPEFSPLKLSAKSLKVTRPTLHSQIATQEEFVDAAEKIFDAYQKGALKVCALAQTVPADTDPRSPSTRSMDSPPRRSRKPRQTSLPDRPSESSSSRSLKELKQMNKK